MDVVTLKSCGSYAASEHWQARRAEILEAVKSCEWPIGSGSFTIYPEPGKERGKGNGVGPIKAKFVSTLGQYGWRIEGPAKNALDQRLGPYDAVHMGPEKPIIAEWETGNISSSHRSMNKLTMLLSTGVISAGVVVVPSRKLYKYLTDRIGNIQELEPYLALWRSVPCESGVLELIVFEHDAESTSVPKMPKGTDGRSLG
jgi:hypothetical protein